MTLCWNTMGWSSPPKTGIMTTRRTTAPPFTTAPGGTATATPPTLMASTCAGSTPPMRTASSGPPGLAGSTLSSSPRWRYDLPVTLRINEKDKREDFFFSCSTTDKFWQLGGYLIWFCFLFFVTKTYLFEFSRLCCLPPDVSLPFCLSPSITQPPLLCWLPLSSSLVPFKKQS